MYFAKRYRNAIIDFEKCIDVYGNGYKMDHTYQFYIAVSKLQLNKFEEAERTLKEDIKLQKEKWKEVHLLDLFYLGISKYEQGKWKEAIIEFDNCLI
ncbi:tetratricopeptide repeat protein [Tenacibaculum maritimum]|uniref:tetratricopeptide repeat protein n=1 Tax=Tenacibaculum maritimum TaxID=107401 RepID=UPI00387694E1